VIQYSEWKYLYPPRPASAVTCDMIQMYENRGWVGQFKKNGTCAVIGIGPDRSFHWMNRHQDTLKWEPPARTVKLLWDMFGSSSWTVLIGELIHAKVTGIRDKLFIFDYIVLDGNYALGRMFGERQKTLNDRFQPFLKAEAYSHWLASEDVWLAKTIHGNLLHTFESMDKPEDEGLVLKNPVGFLRDCGKEGTNGHWQVKVRHPKKNYAF